MARLLTPAEVKEQFGYTPKQMRDYEGQGLIEPVRTPGGHRRYAPEAVEKMFTAAGMRANQVRDLSAQDRFTEFGTSGLRQWGGSIYEERLRALQGRAGRIEKREMRRNDPVISAIFFAILNALKQTSPRIAPASERPADREAAEFVESNLFDMSFSWPDTFTFSIEPQLEQGFSLQEITYKKRLGQRPPKYTENPAQSMYDDGRVGWRKLAPRPAESLAEGNEWVFDDNGGIRGVVQQPETDFTGRGNRTIYIPIQKLLHFRTTVHPANNPEGLEIHRPMYLPYFYSRHITELEAIGIERNLNGIPVAYMGMETTKNGTNSDYELLKDLVTNIRVDEQAGVVIPYPKMGEGAKEGEGVLLELLSPKNTGGNQFDLTKTLDRLDKLKAITVLAQFIMLGMNNVGSYSLSKHQGDIFTLAVSAFLQGIEGVYNRHAIPRLMGINNFPGITGQPELTFSTVGVPDLGALADYVNKLVDKAVITPDQELERHLRQIADLPDMPDEVPEVRPEMEEGDDEGGEVGKILKKKTIIKQEPPDGLSETGLEAYAATDELAEEIEDAWAEFREDVLGGMAIAAAILLFKRKMKAVFEDYYLVLWSIARGEGFDAGEQTQVDRGIDEQMAYLDGFMEELGTELAEESGAGGAAAAAAVGSLFDRRLARALAYAGGAWGFYNRAKVWGARGEDLWTWVGAPIDAGSCPTCVAEFPKPPRPLSQMLLPVVDTECKAGCRHEVVRYRE